MPTSSTPIAIFGTNPDMAQAIRAKLLPEYDVVHISLSLQTAVTELPLICNTDADTSSLAAPSSALGTNASIPASQRRAARAVVFGGGVPDEQVEKVKEAVREKCGDGVRMVRVGDGKGKLDMQKHDIDGVVRGLKEKLGGD